MSFWSWLKARVTPPARASVPPPPPGAQLVAIVNRSNLVSDSSIKTYTDALQIQVTRDFLPAWGNGKSYALVAVGRNNPPPAGSWQVVILDTPDMAGVLGYHEQTDDGQPLGKVFAGADIQYGCSVSVTLSHEVLEMLADPNAQLVAPGPQGWSYAREVGDPCEDDAYAYMINGVLLSDFVYPAYFQTGSAGPYDHRGYIKKPFQLLSGGYQSYFNGQEWTQQRADRVVAWVPSRREFKNIDGSRHWRRKLGVCSWQRSNCKKS